MWSRDFLRDPNDYPGRVDVRYLVNQRDAARFFLEWFLERNTNSYGKMLKAMHRIAACGTKGGNYYRVPTLDMKFSEPTPASTDDKILYASPFPRSVREVYPGQLRTDLEASNIAHPTVDVFEMTSPELTLLRKAGAKMSGASTDARKCCVSEEIRASLSATVDQINTTAPCRKTTKGKQEQLCQAHYEIAFYAVPETWPVCRINARQFARCAPKGQASQEAMNYCSALINQCRSFFLSKDTPNMLRTLFG